MKGKIDNVCKMPGKINLSISQMKKGFGIPGGKPYPNPSNMILVNWLIHHCPPTKHRGIRERRQGCAQWPEGGGCPGKSRCHSIGLFGYRDKEGCSDRTLYIEVQSYRLMKVTEEGQEENEGRICKYAGTWIFRDSPSHKRLVFMLTRLIQGLLSLQAGIPGSYSYHKGH